MTVWNYIGTIKGQFNLPLVGENVGWGCKDVVLHPVQFQPFPNIRPPLRAIIIE